MTDFLQHALLEGVKLLRRRPWLVLVILGVLFLIGNFAAVLAAVFGNLPANDTARKAYGWLISAAGRALLLVGAWLAGWWVAGWVMALWYLLDWLAPTRGLTTKHFEVNE